MVGVVFDILSVFLGENAVDEFFGKLRSALYKTAILNIYLENIFRFIGQLLQVFFTNLIVCDRIHLILFEKSLRSNIRSFPEALIKVVLGISVREKPDNQESGK